MCTHPIMPLSAPSLSPIYVDKAPLAIPAAYLISCMTAIALGGFMLLGFLLKNVSPPTTSTVKAFLTRENSKVSPESEPEPEPDIED